MYEASVRDNALLSFTSELLGEVQSMDKQAQLYILCNCHTCAYCIVWLLAQPKYCMYMQMYRNQCNSEQIYDIQ